MKKLTMLPLLLLLACSSKAQQQSGVITYERKLSFSKQELENSNLPEGFAEMFIQGEKKRKVLYFTVEASLFENSTEKQNDATEYRDGNTMIRASSMEPDERIFINLKEKKKTEQRDLMGKLFLIKDEPLPVIKWKTTGRQKKILGMPCMEATAIEKGNDGEAQNMTAWYTSSIPVSVGPEGITGLPGIIMELSLGNNISFTAIKVDQLEDKNRGNIKAPTQGKKVTAIEFEAINKQKMMELEKQAGGGGSFIIKSDRR